MIDNQFTIRNENEQSNLHTNSTLSNIKTQNQSAFQTRFQNHHNAKFNASHVLKERTNKIENSLNSLNQSKKKIASKKFNRNFSPNLKFTERKEKSECSSFIAKDTFSIQPSFDFEKVDNSQICDFQLNIGMNSFDLDDNDSKEILERKLAETLTEKQKLQDEITELRELFQIIQDDDDSSYQRRIENCENENAQLFDKVASIETENKLLNEKIATLEKENKNLIEKFEIEKQTMKSELCKKEKIIQCLNDGENLDLVLKNDSLVDTISVLEKENNIKKEKLTKLKENLANAKKQIQTLSSEQEAIEVKMKKSAHEMIQLKLKHQKARNEVKAKENLIQQLQETNVNYQKTMMGQKNEIAELNKQIDIRRGMLKKMGEDRTIQVIITEKGRIAELEQLLQESKEKYKDLQTEYKTLKQEFTEKQIEFNKYQQEKAEHTKEAVNLTFRLSQKETELREQQEANLIVENEYNQAKKKIQSLEKIIQSKIDQIRSMQTEKDKVYIKMRENISILTSENDSVKKTLDQSLNEMQECKDKNEQLLIQNKSLEQKYLDVSKLLEKIQNEKDSLSQKLDECYSINNNLNRDLQLIKNKDMQNSDEIVQLNASITEIRKLNHELNCKYNDLKVQNEEQIQHNDDIEKKHNVLKQKYEYILKQKAENELTITSLSGAIDEKSNQISVLEQELNKIKSANEIKSNGPLNQAIHSNNTTDFSMVHNIAAFEIVKSNIQQSLSEMPTQTENNQFSENEYIQQLEESNMRKDDKLQQLHSIINDLEGLVEYLEEQLNLKNKMS